jgi:invasion protein IalB
MSKKRIHFLNFLLICANLRNLRIDFLPCSYFWLSLGATSIPTGTTSPTRFNIVLSNRLYHCMAIGRRRYPSVSRASRRIRTAISWQRKASKIAVECPMSYLEGKIMFATPASMRRFVVRVLGTASLLAAGLGMTASHAAADSSSKSNASVQTAATTPTAPTPSLASPALSTPGASAATGVLPGGSTALSETFNDWQVVCAVQGATKRCAAKQEQISQQNKQLVLAVELTPAATEDKVDGVALLPFGLTLDSGVTLQVDESSAVTPLRFRTCVPGGCVLPLSFDAHTIAQLRAGSVLKAKVAIDGGQDATLSISLKGLSAALDRTAALMADKTASLKH